MIIYLWLLHTQSNEVLIHNCSRFPIFPIIDIFTHTTRSGIDIFKRNFDPSTFAPRQTCQDSHIWFRIDDADCTPIVSNDVYRVIQSQRRSHSYFCLVNHKNITWQILIAGFFGWIHLWIKQEFLVTITSTCRCDPNSMKVDHRETTKKKHYKRNCVSENE